MQFIHNFQLLEQGKRDKYHQYEFGGEKYPGVSGVLGKTEDKTGLLKWKQEEYNHEYITKESTTIGTETHELIEDYLYNRPSSIKVDLLSQAHFDRLKIFLDKIDNIRGLEVFLYSKKLKLGGTSDCVAEYNGNLSIIDYKTKRKDQPTFFLNKHFLQSTAYAIMWEEMTGNPIHQIVILVSSRAGQLQEFIVNPDDYKDELKERITQYYKKSTKVDNS